MERIVMHPDKINRINELARKQRSAAGLTDDEKIEQAALRQEYRNLIKRNLEFQLTGNYVKQEESDV
jgi:uncharacterized protein YnzC (UPF0291/DUF896 family)